MIPRRPLAAGATLRFVALGGSIASDWDNPVATSARAVLTAITAAGHEVTFLEQRGNPALSALLSHRGSRAYKAFTERYPRIQFRTYDLPRGWQRTVWFGREIGTADVIVALPGTPETLLPEIAAVASPHVVRLIDETLPHADAADFRLVRALASGDEDALPFGPAVPASSGDGEGRSERPLLVAYDDRDDAIRRAGELDGDDPEFIVTGTAALPDWTYVPEVELPDLYARHRVTIVSGAGESPWAEARCVLPRAYGCATAGDAKPVSAARHEPVPPAYSADVQARSIVDAARVHLGR